MESVEANGNALENMIPLVWIRIKKRLFKSHMQGSEKIIFSLTLKKYGWKFWIKIALKGTVILQREKKKTIAH